MAFAFFPKMYNLKKLTYFSKVKSQLDKLNINLLTFTEVLLIPCKCTSEKNPLKFEYLHLQKNTCAAILKKYYCFPKILNAAPLTKFVHVNLKFIKTIINKGNSYYKIKITFILGTPGMLNNFKVVKINILFALAKSNSFGFEYLDFLFFGTKLLLHKSATGVNTHKFLKIVLPKHKYGTTTTLFEVSKQLLNKFPQNEIFKYMAYQYDVNNPEWHHENRLDWKISDYTQADLTGKFLDPFFLDMLLHCVLPTRFLILHEFKIPANFSAEELLISMIYNYMIINNIYLSKDKQFIQIVQTHELHTYVIQKLVKVALAQDKSIYNSMLINGLPITEHIIGDFSMLLTKINSILPDVCKILNMYCNPEQVLCKIRNLLLDPQKLANDYFLVSAGFLTKKELLKMKGYSESGKFMDSWFELLTVTVLTALESVVPIAIQTEATRLVAQYNDFLDTDVDAFLATQVVNVYL